MDCRIARTTRADGFAIRSRRVFENPSRAGGTNRLVLRDLGVPADFPARTGAVCDASVCCGIPQLECHDAARLHRRCLPHRTAATGNRSRARVAVHGLEPHFGILFPLALAASGQWRAVASAAGTAVLLVSGSVVVFGTAVWEFLPLELMAQAHDALFADPDADPRGYFGHLQTVYGLFGYLNGGAALAWLAQGITTCGTAAIVWIVWRSRVNYALKAATLSASVLIATPYAHAYDMAAIAIPIAFLASDQMRNGLLRGEQTIMVGLFGAILAVLFTFSAKPVGPTFGTVPVGAVATIALLGVILRRAVCDALRPAVFGSRALAHESPHE